MFLGCATVATGGATGATGWATGAMGSLSMHFVSASCLSSSLAHFGEPIGYRGELCGETEVFPAQEGPSPRPSSSCLRLAGASPHGCPSLGLPEEGHRETGRRAVPLAGRARGVEVLRRARCVGTSKFCFPGAGACVLLPCSSQTTRIPHSVLGTWALGRRTPGNPRAF